MVRSAVVAALVLMLAACTPGETTNAEIAKIEAVVRASLRDPDSAKFSKVASCGAPGIYRGEVNAKNAYGGYAGAEIFYYAWGEAALLSEAGSPRFKRLQDACVQAMYEDAARMDAEVAEMTARTERTQAANARDISDPSK